MLASWARSEPLFVTVGYNQMMLHIDGDLHVVADDAGTAPARAIKLKKPASLAMYRVAEIDWSR
jgi:hypothetical protein